MEWNSLVPDCTVKVVNQSGEVVGEIATLRCVPAVLSNVVSTALLFAGVVSLIFIIVAGYKFMTSGGVPQQVDSARKTFVFAIVGLLLVLSSFAVVKFIAIATGVECINGFGSDRCEPESTP